MSNDKNKKENVNDTVGKEGYYAALTGFHRAVPIILTAVAVFIAICFITGGTGLAGEGLVSVLKGALSYGAYAIPVMIILHSVFYAEDVAKKRILTRTVFSLITVLAVSAIEYTVCYWDSDIVFEPMLHFTEQINGGFVGTVLGFGITAVFGRVGLIIICVATMALYLAFFFANSESTFGKFTLAVLSVFANFFALIERGIKKFFNKIKNAKAEKEQRELEKSSDELLDDNFFAADNGMSEFKIRELGISESKSRENAEQNPSLQHTVRLKSEVDFTEEDVVEEEEYVIETVEEPVEASQKKRALNLDYGFDVPGSSMRERDFPAADEKPSQRRRDQYGIDASAETVFTANFDPFNFAEAERAAARMSSKASTVQRNRGISEMADRLPTYEEMQQIEKENAEKAERARRLEEFERRKRELVERARRESGESDSNTVANIAADNEDSITDTAEREEAYTPASTYAQASEIAPTTYAATPTYTPAPTREPAGLEYESEDIREIVKMVTGGAPADADEQVEEVDDFSSRGSDESDEEIALRIAERIAMKNPAYARSANELHTYTQVIGEDIESASDASTTDENDETVEFSFESESTDESAVSESEPEQFKPYEIPEEVIAQQSASDDTLMLERTMLSPTLSETAEDDTSDTEIEKTETDEIVWVEDKGDEPVVNEIASDATVFTFDDSAEDDEVEDEEDDSTEIFGTPEEECEDETVEEIPPEEQNPDVIKQRELFPFLDAEKDEAAANDPVEESVDETTEESADESADESEEESEDESDVNDDEPPFDGATEVKSEVNDAPIPAEPVIAEKVEVIKDEPEAPKKPDYSNYEFPPIDLLGLDEDSCDENVQAEIQENADRLIDTLASFNVTASIKGVDRGPRITRYEVVPAKGVKVSSIMGLQDDIALSLAADGIRMEAPIPGKSAVGVEIPNKKSVTVRLRELLETEDFKAKKTKTAICIGKDVAGQPVINDISAMPHLLIAGATGMGKSVCINSLLISILYKARPDEVKLIMIDPKQVEFTMYNGIPHLLIPVVSDAKQAAGALMWAVEEMERRYNLLNPLCVRNADAYNEKVAQDPSLGEPMSKIIIVIDEFADLMLQVKDPVENLVMRIAQKARAAGIHLIIGTQRPSTNVITGTIKANIPSRISCKVASNVDSRTVLDGVGAEKLLNKGDMLFSYAGAIKPLRVQGAFVSDGEVEAVMSHLKQFSNGASYDESVMEEIKKAADRCSKKSSGGSDSDDGDSESSGEGYLNDRQFLDAVDVAINSGRLSTALLQRKLSIGYGKAARFIDVMCDMGIISEPNGQKPREVLMTADEWHETLSRRMIDG